MARVGETIDVVDSHGRKIRINSARRWVRPDGNIDWKNAPPVQRIQAHFFGAAVGDTVPRAVLVREARRVHRHKCQRRTSRGLLVNNLIHRAMDDLRRDRYCLVVSVNKPSSSPGRPKIVGYRVVSKLS